MDDSNAMYSLTSGVSVVFFFKKIPVFLVFLGALSDNIHPKSVIKEEGRKTWGGEGDYG